MKSLFNTIICLASSLFVLSSCDDILDTVPTDRISSSVYWQTEDDAEYAANAIYQYLDGTRLFTYDGLTDILHHNIQFSDGAAMERGEYDSNMAFVQSVYTDSYEGIRAVNYFLENVDKITVDDRTNLNVLSAEVRTIRAYLYMQLVSLYGDIPLVTSTIASIPESKEVLRTPVAEVWAFVNSELNEVSSVLPLKSSDKGRITKGAALALSARAYLYQSNWSKAAEMAKSVMDLNQYQIFYSYKNLFKYANENNPEVILDKEFIKDSYSNNVFAYLAPFSQKKIGPSVVPTKNIFDAYRMTNGKMIGEAGSGFTNEHQYENRDPRLGYSIYLPGDTLSNGSIYDPAPGSGSQDEVSNTYLATSLGYNVKKYINDDDLADPYNCGINIILIRYAEVLLTYAEAKIELNEIDDSVLSAINQIRTRQDVNMPTVPEGLSQSDMRDIVRNERMVELAFEGVRLFDCRRWKAAEKLFPGNVYGMTYKNESGEWTTVQIGGYVKVFDPNKHYLWPIPQKEMDLNPNFDQNPGW